MQTLEDKLLTLEREVCRAKNRAGLLDPHTSSWGGVGKLITRLKNYRNTHLAKDTIGKITNKDIIGKFEGRAKSNAVRAFLSGQAGAMDWAPLALDMMRFVLGWEIIRNKLARQTIDRIVRFFLAGSPNSANLHDGDWLRNQPNEVPDPGWFFGPFHPHHPQSTRESLAEMRFLASRGGDSGSVSDGIMIRIVVDDAFRMVHDGRLTESGTEALRCAAAGFRQVFVFPDKDVFSTEPRKSYNLFQKLAAKPPEGLNLSALSAMVYAASVNVQQPPKHSAREAHDATVESPAVRHPWEYLHPHLRYIFYRWREQGSDKEQHRLMVSRHPRHGPCLFEPDREERASFWDWATLFVLPVQASGEVPTHPEPKAGTSNIEVKRPRQIRSKTTKP